MISSNFDAQIETFKKEGANIRILQPKKLEQWKSATRYREMQATWVKQQENKGYGG